MSEYMCYYDRPMVNETLEHRGKKVPEEVYLAPDSLTENLIVEHNLQGMISSTTDMTRYTNNQAVLEFGHKEILYLTAVHLAHTQASAIQKWKREQDHKETVRLERARIEREKNKTPQQRKKEERMEKLSNSFLVMAILGIGVPLGIIALVVAAAYYMAPLLLVAVLLIFFK